MTTIDQQAKNRCLVACAASYEELAKAYRELHRVLHNLGMYVKVPARDKLTDWKDVEAFDEEPMFWPEGDDVIEICHPQCGFVARIVVRRGVYYGWTILGGNHDLIIEELRGLLQSSLEAAAKA